MLNDDRLPVFEAWLERSLGDLSPGIHIDVEHWLRTLHDGGPRARPRSQATCWSYLRLARPALLAWSERYDHLREVTRDDILPLLDTLHGGERHHTLTALRSLFRHCKRKHSIFRDPAARLHVDDHPRKLALPLDAQEITKVTQATRTPLDRLIIALAAIHAARPKAIRELQLDDVDLGNRRLTIAGRTRPLDELTRQVILHWLDYRKQRWPSTANQHLLIKSNPPWRPARSARSG